MIRAAVHTYLSSFVHRHFRRRLGVDQITGGRLRLKELDSGASFQNATLHGVVDGQFLA